MTMEELVKRLNEASTAYYNGEEIISNKEYDELYDTLVAMEKETGIRLPNSPTLTVGAKAVDSLAKVTHEYPALSLDKTKDIDVLIAKLRDNMLVEKQNFCVMWKLDGSTLVLTYDNGILTKAATRGNGEIGSDITKNARFIKGIPTKISYKGHLVVRGESLMSYSNFARLNEALPAEEQYKNPRNLANASVSMLNPLDMMDRCIEFKAFKLVYAEEAPDEFSQALTWLQSLGFGIVPYSVVTIDSLKDEMETWGEQTEEYDYPVDGLVIAYELWKVADAKEGTGHNPHILSGFAFKWQDDSVVTILRDIVWSPSRTGLLNPVAVFDPVELEGTTVSRASLHNVSYISELNLKIGDRITVYKANKIIPQVEKNLDKERHALIMYGYMPHVKDGCPCCKQPTEVVRSVKEGSVTLTLQCLNPNCTAKKIGSLIHFCERDCMNIEGISESTITTFVEKGYLTEFSDFYHLDRYEAEIKALEGFGEKSYDNLINAVEKSRKANFIGFMHGMGIPNIGKGQAKLLAPAIVKWARDHDVSSQEHMVNALERMVSEHYDFQQIDGFGEVIAKSLTEWVKKEMIDPWEQYSNGELENLESEVINLLPELTFTDVYTDYVKETTSSPISGLTFVITGDVYHFKNRAELQSKIESLGGKCAGSVSKNTSYLINNDVTSTSGKNKKAQEIGIPIISEEDFLKLIQ